MAGKTAILSVRILGDSKGAVDAMGKAEGRASKLGGALKGLGGIALGAATVAGGALIGLGVSGVKAAGDLEQSAGAIDSVFKDQASIMHGYADDAATTLGLTKNEYNELATVMGTQLKNGGTAMEDLGTKTNELMGLGADLSSMFGGTTADAVGALSSALKGERDPIEKYGVSLKQAEVDARAAELGFQKVGGALSSEASQAATLSLIMDQTADAHGNFSRETGTFAGQVSILSSQWGNFIAQVGTLLLPLLTTLLTFLTGSVMPGLQAFADVIGPQISTAIGTVAPMFSQLISGFTGVTAGASPLQGILAAIMPHLLGIGQAVMGLLPTLVSFGSSILPLIVSAVAQIVPTLMSIAGAVIPAIVGILQTALPIIQSIAGAVIPAVIGAISTLVPTILQIIPPIVSIVQSILGILGPAIQWLLPIVTGVFGALVTIIQGAIQIVVAVLSSVAALLRGDFSGAWTAIQGVVTGVITMIRGVIQQGMTYISALTGQSVAQVKQTFTQGWQLIVTTVTTKIGDLIGKVKEIPGKITSALGNLGSLLKGAGKDLIQGLINGVGSMGQALKDKASGLANSAVGAIKGALGIASPSRVMMQVGKWTGEGFVRGIDRMRRSASGAMTDLVTVPDVPKIPLSAEAGRRGGTGGAAPDVHVHIEGAFVGDELSLAREIERLVNGRRALLGGAA